MRIQGNWAQAAAEDQQEFVIGVMAMWYADPETYGDAMNAQSCWAAAGCLDYDATDDSFTYEDYSYDDSSDD